MTKSGQSIIASLPDDRILVETDAPFGVNLKDIDGIKKQIEITIKGISTIRNKNMLKAIHKNSAEVFSKWGAM